MVRKWLVFASELSLAPVKTEQRFRALFGYPTSFVNFVWVVIRQNNRRDTTCDQTHLL